MNQPALSRPEIRAQDYKKLAQLLESWTGIRLQGKVHMMTGRLSRRLEATGSVSYTAYYDRLVQAGKGSREGELFINALTTNKTSFFRETHHFDFLVSTVFEQAKARSQRGAPRRLRLYSAGCSRGAEPYSMAMVAAQHLPASQGWDVKILATDLDTAVLDVARAGEYSHEDIEGMPELMRKRWMQRRGRDGYRVHPDLPGLITFARANLIERPFPVRGAFDAVFCRNVMIYFTPDVQRGLVDNLLGLVNPGGHLMVGHSESLQRADVTRGTAPGVYCVGPGAGARTPPASPEAKAPGGRLHTRPAATASKSLSTRGAQMPPRRAPARPASNLPLRRIVLGEWAVGRGAEEISTLLGSCVAACLYDPGARIGGMNHFMLPQAKSAEGNPARYGVHAMELLINGLLKAGASRPALVAKVFGAGAVNHHLSSPIGPQNEAFIRNFLEAEGIPLLAERLGGGDAREVIFNSQSGEARVRVVRGADARVEQVRKAEVRAVSIPPPAMVREFSPDDVLF